MSIFVLIFAAHAMSTKIDNLNGPGSESYLKSSLDQDQVVQIIVTQALIYIIIWLTLYVLSVQPACLDPPISRRRTLYYMRKSLGIKVLGF
jgi:hypothetical protein